MYSIVKHDFGQSISILEFNKHAPYIWLKDCISTLSKLY